MKQRTEGALTRAAVLGNRFQSGGVTLWAKRLKAESGKEWAKQNKTNKKPFRSNERRVLRRARFGQGQKPHLKGLRGSVWPLSSVIPLVQRAQKSGQGINYTTTAPLPSLEERDSRDSVASAGAQV